MNRKQRRLRNFLLDPSRQLRSAVHFIGLYVAYSIAIILVFLHVTFQQHSFVMTYLDHEEKANFSDMLQNPIIVSGLIEVVFLFLLFLAIAMTLTILFSHRVFGPLIPIKRQLEALSNGDYSNRIRLRKNDELKDVAEAVNQLSAALEDKYSKDELTDVAEAVNQLSAALENKQRQEI